MALRRKNLGPDAAETTTILGKRPRDREKPPPSDQGNAQKKSDTIANRREYRASAAELRAKRREEKAQRRRKEEAQRAEAEDPEEETERAEAKNTEEEARRRDESEARYQAIRKRLGQLNINKKFYTMYYLRF